jgi:two-component system chemotaxis sensor kinase CheA
MVDGFRDKLKMIALMPFSSLTGTFPRMMREISAEIGHEFEFIITGSNIEIDRRVLDELRDPLIHLLRNAADHGIESKDRRAKSGKKTIGRVELSIGISADKKIEISVSDDGNGIDTGRIRCKLIDEMHMPESVVAEMTEDKIVNHIFDSGFTTSSIITTISGRGLGMAIVRDKIEALGGSIHIDNHPGAGVAFILSLPAALSSQRGILFCVGARTFAMPTNGIEAFTRIKQSDIQTIKGIQSLTLYGKTLPVFDMAPILGLSSDFNSKEKITIILISLSGINAGFIVDNVLREREMLVKPLGSLMPSVSNVSGITVTSSGEVVPVLNSRDVLQNAMNSLGTTTPLRRSSDKVEKPTIMLAEDSITSRTLLANILEAAGYEVITAVDGEAAWQQLQRVKIDLLVSDIEMPRMDGFELTEKVRNFPRLTTLPIVLVTSLSKQEDRERGINLGANAYITKGDFSQSHLLDTVERLL